MKYVDQSPELLPRKVQDLQRQIDDLRSERRAASTTISDGDLTIENGGAIRVKGGGIVEVVSGIIRSRFIFFQTDVEPQGIKGQDVTPGSSWEYFIGHLGSAVIGIRALTMPIHMRTDTNDVRIDHDTTSASANTVLDSTTKRITRSTSSRRYKQDIEDITVDPAAVLGMRGRTWRDRNAVEENPDTETRYVGFIAEELDELGLTEFVAYDGDGRPEAIAYDRLSVALLAVVKDQERRLADLEATTAQHGELLTKITGLLRGLLPKGSI